MNKKKYDNIDIVNGFTRFDDNKTIKIVRGESVIVSLILRNIINLGAKIGISKMKGLKASKFIHDAMSIINLDK